MTPTTDNALTDQLLYRICNAPKRHWPFPHFFVENVFPADYYRSLMRHLDAKTDYTGGDRQYRGRTFAETTDVPGLDGLATPHFARQVMVYFADEIRQRYGGQKIELFTDLRLIRDHETYRIGPHTDAAWKLVSLLFYLPIDARYAEHGTSIYMPNDPQFRCPGGPHHGFEHFHQIFTAPYVPNSCFGFWKTDNSFHGVEEIAHEIRRDVLLFNIYDQQLYLQAHRPTPPQQPQEG